MDIKETLKQLKALFADAPVEAPAEQPAPEGVQCTLPDGKVMVCTPSMEQGATVTIDGQPAPDGEYPCTGPDGMQCVCVVSGGLISEVKPSEAPAEAPAEDMSKQFAAEFAAFKAEYQTQKEAFSKMLSDFAAVNETVKKQDEAIKGLLSVVEQLSKLPAENPAPAPKNAFAKQSFEDKESRIMATAKAIENLRKQTKY